MSKRRRDKNREDSAFGLKRGTAAGICAVFSFACAVFFVLAAFSRAGIAGEAVFAFFKNLFGIGYFLIPLSLLLLSGACIRTIDASRFGVIKSIGVAVFFLSGLGLVELFFEGGAGIVGRLAVLPFTKFFDIYAGAILLVAFLVISLIVILEIQLSPEFLFFWRRFRRKEASPIITTGDGGLEGEPLYENEAESESEKSVGLENSELEQPLTETPRDIAIMSITKTRLMEPYIPPPIRLLEKDRGKPGAGDVKANANIIKRTLLNFGITVEVEEVTVGPSVTRYAVKPAEGVRLSKILSLQNNLELALAAHPVRIEAPIPGRSLVGIEIPNSAKTTVGLAALLSHHVFTGATKPLFFTLGRDVSGNAHFADLARLPHILIAGATGSGKSVTIHTLITSLLYRNSPEMMRLIMIDPKRVELTLYNGIPHLLTAVLTDAKKAILALKWLTGEMERRYNVLEEHRVRDVASYHANILSPALLKKKEASELPETMPYIVTIVDELADIMSSYPRELEAAVVRLAQMSRAVGIHLVLSTQRPSVNVITGLIKANIPGRVALQVASQVDSRTILDMSGAEKLLGAGDMLYLSADMSKPVRLQGAHISEEEVKKVTQYLKKNYGGELENLSLSGNSGQNISFEDSAFEEDELYEDARSIVVEAGKASTSYLQRRLRIGYARAARLIDMLEERGVIGPGEGAKPRQVLFDEMNNTNSAS